MASETPQRSQGRLCEAHGLAVADDGKCVLCRRAERPSMLGAPRQETTGDRVVTILLLICMVAAVGALVWLIRQPRPEARPGSTVPTPALSPPPVTDAAPPDAGPATTDAAADNAESDSDRDVSRAKARIAETRLSRLRAARKDVVVRMYSTEWCSICDNARFYLQASGVAFEELRIDLDPKHEQRLSRINGAKTVPTFTVGEEVLLGYNPYDLEAKIDAHARRAAGMESPVDGTKKKGDAADGKPQAREE